MRELLSVSRKNQVNHPQTPSIVFALQEQYAEKVSTKSTCHGNDTETDSSLSRSRYYKTRRAWSPFTPKKLSQSKIHNTSRPTIPTTRALAIRWIKGHRRARHSSHADETLIAQLRIPWPNSWTCVFQTDFHIHQFRHSVPRQHTTHTQSDEEKLNNLAVGEYWTQPRDLSLGVNHVTNKTGT